MGPNLGWALAAPPKEPPLDPASTAPAGSAAAVDPPPVLAAARSSTGAALQLAAQAPLPARAFIVEAARHSFVDGFSRGSLVCSGVVLAGAAFAFFVLPSRLPTRAPAPQEEAAVT